MQNAKRVITHYTSYVAGSPEKTFPLLCPVREYEWIELWRGKLVYSDSGVAELDCIFTTENADLNDRETWTCSRFEPPYAIDYVRMSSHTVTRLELRLMPAGPGTRITAGLVFTALDKAGDEYLGGLNSGTCEKHFKPCFIMLDHFLRTGTMLPAAEAAARAA